MIYAGDLIAGLVSLASAAYVAVHTVDASVLSSKGFAAVYRYSSTYGNLLGVWELIFVSLWLLWSLTVTITAFYTGADIFDRTQAREFAAYTEGTYGQGVNPIAAIKFFVLLMVMAMGTAISGYVLAEHANEILTWFN